MKYNVSIIVPVYNVEKYLKRCMDSLLNQTMKNIQIILVDDGSTDDSGMICDEYEEQYENITVIHQENSGLTKARRTGLDMSEGEYIAFVDSDDWIAENMCEKMYEYAKKKNCKLLFSDYKVVKDGEVSVCKGVLGDELTIELFYEKTMPAYVWNKLYHSSLKEMMRVGINISQAEDMCMLLPLMSNLTNRDIGYLPEAFYYYAQRENSSSNSNFFIQSCAIGEYLSGIKYILANHNIKYRNYVSYYCVQCMYWGINNPERAQYRADYVAFLQNELYPYICKNPLLKKYTSLFSDIVRDVIPSNIVYIARENDNKECLNSWEKVLKNYKFIKIGTDDIDVNILPSYVHKAYEDSDYKFVKEYLLVKEIYERGGIALDTNIFVEKSFGEIRLNKAFVGYVDRINIGGSVWGSVSRGSFVSDLLDTYLEESIYNEKRMGIQERINIVLRNKYKLIPKGKECFLMGELVKVYTPFLFYRRINQENIAHIYDELEELAKKKGKILLDEELYFSEVASVFKSSKEPIGNRRYEYMNKVKKLEEQNFVLRQQLAVSQEAYQLIVNSKAWKITSPIRKFLDKLKKLFGGKINEQN